MTSLSSFQLPLHQAKPGSLAFAILGAACLLQGIQQGKSLQHSLPELAQAWRLDAANRGAIQAITYHTLRHWARAQAVRSLLLPKPKPALLGHLIEVALALQWPEAAPPYPAHTVVSQAVEAAKAAATLRHLHAVVNGSLRRWQREQGALSLQIKESDELKTNLPSWWLKRIKTLYSSRYNRYCEDLLSQPVMTLREYAKNKSNNKYLETLHEAGHKAAAIGADAIALHGAVPIERLPGFHEGACSVQDFGAQLAAHLLGARDGESVLDACAAPGGKTAHILELADVDMLALDSDETRLKRVDDNLQRLKLKAKLKHADAADVKHWWGGKPFNRILLDAPCSASGIVSRHPDIAWLRRESDIKALAQTQARLLKSLWVTLKPGGRLLYCTCSVFDDEGEQQTTAFAAKTPDARVIKPDLKEIDRILGHNLSHDNLQLICLDGGLQLLPQRLALDSTQKLARIPHDGFYYALFEKLHAPRHTTRA